MIRVADYIFKSLAHYGIKHVFLVVGGGAMYLNNALEKEKRIKYICTHHEQGAAIAAEGYARTKGCIAVVNVTSGPGGTNTLTGVIGQWLDSVPVLYLSGQVKFETTISSVPECCLRQLGDQEINIIDIVRPVTKYAKMITEPESIKIELEKAISIATSGRPGPVWLDIPLNVQSALIDEHNLKSEKIDKTHVSVGDDSVGDDVVSAVVEELKKTKRPLIIAGHGIRIAKAQKNFLKLVDLLNIPVVTTFNGFDLISSDNDNFVGRIGTLGSRGGNFALQNADLVICLGTRNNIRQVGYNWETFAKNAKKIIVDIDKAELNKKTVKGDILVHSDANIFIEKLLNNTPKGLKIDKAWLKWCIVRKKKYPIVLNEYKTKKVSYIHPYYFFEKLTEAIADNAIIVAGNGTACVALFQAGIVKQKQRIFWNSGCASMGYALPASIGAALAANRDVICIEGDGSIQMNLQELQTIKHNNLPIKIFVLNNSGYRSIEQTQTVFFKGHFIGCNRESGVSFPDFSKLADLYNLKYFRINSSEKIGHVIKNIIKHKGPAMCEVVIGNKYIFSPKQSSEKKPDGTMVSKPLEDLYPFLERDEFYSNMIPNRVSQDENSYKSYKNA